MKTILVDAVYTFVVDGVIDVELKSLLDSFPNKKIILTNANDEQVVEFGLVDLPYELFTFKQNPKKVDSVYFVDMLKHYGLSAQDVVYFEHDPDAVKSATSVGITSYHFDETVRNLSALKAFLEENV